MSSRPPGAFTGASSGRSMQDEAPPYSKDRKSGPSSSQLLSRPVGRLCSKAEKSGARNGLASCLATTDFGTTRRSATVGAASNCGSGSGSSGTSKPAASCISRLRVAASSETTTSSGSRTSREVSRAAVLARMVATPSSRLSCSVRCPSVLSASFLIRDRSSRTSRATTWNFVRPEGRTLPRCAAASTSRTALARTGIIPSLSRSRTRRGARDAPARRVTPVRAEPPAAPLRAAPGWRWPRAKNFLLRRTATSGRGGPGV